MNYVYIRLKTCIDNGRKMYDNCKCSYRYVKNIEDLVYKERTLLESYDSSLSITELDKLVSKSIDKIKSLETEIARVQSRFLELRGLLVLKLKTLEKTIADIVAFQKTETEKINFDEAKVVSIGISNLIYVSELVIEHWEEEFQFLKNSFGDVLSLV